MTVSYKWSESIVVDRSRLLAFLFVSQGNYDDSDDGLFGRSGVPNRSVDVCRRRRRLLEVLRR